MLTTSELTRLTGVFQELRQSRQCPRCQSSTVSPFSDGLRCQQCGHQFFGGAFSLREEFILEEILEELRRIEKELKRSKKSAVSATLTIQSEGVTIVNAHVNDKPGVASWQEFDGPSGTGNKVPSIGPVTFASDNTAVATVDPASGQLAYVGAGTANITATDAGNGITNSAPLVLSAAVAVSGVVTLTPGQ